MKYCKNCGAPMDDNDNACTKCGTRQDQPAPYAAQNPQPVDNGGFGWGLLGCCIPLVGLILFLVWKDTKPKTAKAAGIGALVSVCVSVLYYILVVAIGVGAGIMG